METVKDYAARHGITYEAVRKQIRLYEEELEGHIIKKGREQMLLDDFAVDFLDQHRNPRTITLEEVNEDARQALMAAHEKIRLLQEKVIELQQDQIEAEKLRARLEIFEHMEQDRNEEIREAHEKLLDGQAALTDARGQIEQLLRRQEEAEAELNSYERTIFGLYRKKKEQDR